MTKEKMTLKERDKKHLWHPLTQHQLHPESVAIVKAEGCTLYDEDGGRTNRRTHGRAD